MSPEGCHEFRVRGNAPHVPRGTVLEGSVFIDGTVVGPGSSRRLGRPEEQKLSPAGPEQGAVGTSKVACFSRSQSGLVEAGEEALETAVDVPHGPQQGPGLPRVDNDPAIDRRNVLRARLLHFVHRVGGK